MVATGQEMVRERNEKNVLVKKFYSLHSQRFCKVQEQRITM